jgi:hypothetical protein
LDVYGDLDPEAHKALGEHLKNCEACWAERQKSLSLIQVIRHAGRSPIPSPESGDRMTRSILRQFSGKSLQRSWWKRPPSSKKGHLLPALVGACAIILFIVGWLAFHELADFGHFRSGENLYSEEASMQKDLDVIKNLELLEEMESIEKLVQIVDEPRHGSISIGGAIMVRRNTGNVMAIAGRTGSWGV